MTGALALLPVSLSRADDTPAVTTQSAVTVAPAASAPAAPPKLPYGVEDVLKLSRAQVGDEIIVKYVKNSGTLYNLAPADIVYLRNSGVSQTVMNAMLDQRKLAEVAAQTPATTAAPALTTAPTGAEADMSSSPPADSYNAPADTAVQAPLTPPASTVSVIPWPAATSAYYGYYYPYPYYGYYPGVSFAFGFGPGCYYGHGYYGHGHGYYGHGSSAVHGGHGGGGHGGGHR
jgi:hypothetical protein